MGGDVPVWVGYLKDDVRAALERRNLDESNVLDIRERSSPTRPIRYYRRCATMHGRKLLNIDRAVKTWTSCAEEPLELIRAAAWDIDPETADVCLASCYGDPHNFDEDAENVTADLFFYRSPGSSLWVAETYLVPALATELRERIRESEMRVLWIGFCDD